MKTLFLLVLLMFVSFVERSSAQDLTDVSMVQLIANPKDFDGKVVRVIGFVRLEFEGNAIYLHQDDYKHGISKNGLWVDVPERIMNNQSHFNEKYVILEGTFNAAHKGHMGLFSGSIQKVSRFEVWNDKDIKR